MATHYEKGSYKAVITGQRFGTLPTGTDYFAIDFEPTEAMGANNLPDPIYKRDLNLWFSEKAASHSVEKLRRLGWNGARLTELEPGSPNFHDLAGVEIEVVCGRNAKDYEDWSLAGSGQQVPKESDKGVAAKLDRLYGKALAAGAKKKPAPQPALAAAGVDDSSIPF